MTISTEASTEDQSTLVATEQPQPTGQPDEESAGEQSQLGGQDLLDLQALGAHVLAVFGPFGTHTLIEVPTAVAEKMFAQPLAEVGRTSIVEAVEHDIEVIRLSEPLLADSALAASALAMAFELANPYNSATSKSMCARALLDALDTLRALCPPEQKADGLDDLARRRAERLTGKSATAD